MLVPQGVVLVVIVDFVEVVHAMTKPKPLKKKTMTLNQLQLRTLDVLRRVRFQFGRQAHEEGMSDSEFIDRFVEPLETDIHQDRYVLRMRIGT